MIYAFGHSIELTFSEGEKREDPPDRESIDGLDRKSKRLRTRHPDYHLESERLQSSITIRRPQANTSIEKAPSKAVKKGVEALEQASNETDSLVVDALLSGGSEAVGIRHATSEKEEVFRTTFFHKRSFSEVEPEVLLWIQSSLENEVFERKRQDKEFSSLQEPIAEFGKAMEKSDSEVSMADGDEDLSYRARAFASAISNE